MAAPAGGMRMRELPCAGARPRCRSAPASRRGNMPTSQFTPPQGDYNLIVHAARRHASARSPPAAWSSRAPTGPRQARANLIAALAAQQAARGGKVRDPRAPQRAPRRQRRDGRRARAAPSPPSATRSRSTNISAPICRPSAARGSTGRWARTRSRSAARPAWTMPCSSTPRTASPRPGGWRCRCSASPAASSASARPSRRRRPVRLCLPGRSEDRRGRLVQRPPDRQPVPGSTSATSARPRARRRWSSGCSAG